MAHRSELNDSRRVSGPASSILRQRQDDLEQPKKAVSFEEGLSADEEAESVTSPSSLWWKDQSKLQQFLCEIGLASESPMRKAGKSRFIYPHPAVQGDPELARNLWDHLDVF